MSEKRMMKCPEKLSAKFLVSMVVSLGAPMCFAATDLPVAKIVELNEAARKVLNSSSEVELVTERDGRDQKIKMFNYWQKIKPDMVHYDRMTRFNAPASIKGQGILFLEKSDEERDVLLYLPRFKKIRRIENSGQSGSFMGTVFSYSDISTPAASELNHELVKKEACPAQQGKLECYVLRAKGKTPKIAERIGYAYMDIWIRSDNFMTVQVEGHDSKDALIKRLQFSEIVEVDKARKTWFAKKIEAVDPKTKDRSLFVVKKLEVNKGVEDSVFTRETLERP